MQASVTPRFEELKDGQTARVWLDVAADGFTHRIVHVSGPKDDVLDYFENRITMEQLRQRWMPDSVTYPIISTKDEQ